MTLEEFNKAVVKINIDNLFSGTGFFIAKDLILTNQHVIGDAQAQQITIGVYDNQSQYSDRKCEEIVWHRKESGADFAILRCEGEAPFVPNLDFSWKPKAGETIEVKFKGFGKQFLNEATSFTAKFSDVFQQNMYGLSVDRNTRQVEPGDSGSPLILDDRVIGILFARKSNDATKAFAYLLSNATDIMKFAENQYNKKSNFVYELIQSIKEYNPKAKALLQRTQGKEWNKNINNIAKVILQSSYAGAVGISLGRLLAIDIISGKDFKKDYIHNAYLTAKVSFQLLIFSLLIDLENAIGNQKISISKADKDILKNYFEDFQSPDVKILQNVFETLKKIAEENNTKSYLTELQNFKPDEKYFEMFGLLQDLDEQENLQDNQIITKTENALLYILKPLGFLAKYQMVSLKAVSFQSFKNFDEYYLIFKNLLEAKQSEQGLKIELMEMPLSLSVKIYDTDLKNSQDLFPFIIDYNSLINEDKPKICIYSHKDLLDNNLVFYDIVKGEELKINCAKGEVKTNEYLDALAKDEKEKISLFRQQIICKVFDKIKQKIASV